MNNKTEAKLTDLSGMQKAIEEILKQAWERGRKYGQNEETHLIREKVLREFAEWVKTQPIYVGGGISDREILVIRNGKFESAIEVYIAERSDEE